MEQQKVFLTNIVRTPLGCPGKSLDRFMSSDLAAAAIKKLLAMNELEPLAVDQVVFGQSLPSTMPNNIGHYAWLKAELPIDVPGYTVQAIAGSGLQALRNAYYLVATGNDGIVMAGGADSYSAAPFVMRDVRLHFKPQDRLVIDSLDEAECCTQPEPLSRQEQYDAAHKDAAVDAAAFAAADAEKAAAFKAACEKDVVSMSYVDRKKGEIIISADEWLGKAAEGVLAPKADCAAVTLLVSEKEAAEKKLSLVAEVEGFAVAGCDPVKMQEAGALAAGKLLKKTGKTADRIALFEIIENSAADVLDTAAALGIGAEKVNPFGGALSFGKCDGAEGLLMLQRLCAALKSGQEGMAVTYSAGGMGMAVLVKKL